MPSEQSNRPETTTRLDIIVELISFCLTIIVFFHKGNTPNTKTNNHFWKEVLFIGSSLIIPLFFKELEKHIESNRLKSFISAVFVGTVIIAMLFSMGLIIIQYGWIGLLLNFFLPSLSVSLFAVQRIASYYDYVKKVLTKKSSNLYHLGPLMSVLLEIFIYLMVCGGLSSVLTTAAFSILPTFFSGPIFGVLLPASLSKLVTFSMISILGGFLGTTILQRFISEKADLFECKLRGFFKIIGLENVPSGISDQIKQSAVFKYLCVPKYPNDSNSRENPQCIVQ